MLAVLAVIHIPCLYILLKIPQELPDRIGSQASLSPKGGGRIKGNNNSETK